MNDITVIHADQYPPQLKEIHNSPLKLYARGSADILLRPCIAIVGTRRATSYGIQATKELTRDLVSAGFCIVSGLAYGIDATAHQAALAAGGDTIAVLASSLDDESIYPQGNLGLAKKIITAGGCLVSEQESPAHPFKYQFPLRNRIISGLSLGVVVVEAQIKSGARITAYSALQQNREVFAVPGNIFSSFSEGTNALIKEGAKLATHAQDIIQEFPHLIKEMRLTSGEKNATYHPANTQESLVLQNLTSEPKYIDFILRQTNLPAQDILATLTTLESKGIVASSQGMFYLPATIHHEKTRHRRITDKSKNNFPLPGA